MPQEHYTISEFFKKDFKKQMNTLHEVAKGENKIYDLKKKNLKNQINLLVEESQEFFGELRKTYEYKKEFNKALKLYELSDKQELNGAINMQKENILMFKNSRSEIFEKYSFLKPMFNLKNLKPYEALKAQRQAYKLAIYLQVRDVLITGKGFDSSNQERLIAKKVAENDIDTTRLKDYKAFRLPSGYKVVAVKDDTRKPLPEREVLKDQIKVAVRKSVSVAVKRYREETIKKDVNFMVNNKKAKAFEEKYSKLINEDFDARPGRYKRECETANDVVNTYFDENGHSSGKYSDLGRLLKKEGIVVEVAPEPENQL